MDIHEVWIVDVEGQTVEIYRTPTAFPDLRVSVADLLGDARAAVPSHAARPFGDRETNKEAINEVMG